MTQTALDVAVKGPTFHPISTSRKIKNNLATILFATSFLIAMVPLVWLLYTVVERGLTAITSSTWCSRSLAGVLPEQMAGGVYHAIYGTIVQAAIAAVPAVPLGVMLLDGEDIYGSGVDQGSVRKTILADAATSIPAGMMSTTLPQLRSTTPAFSAPDREGPASKPRIRS